MTKRFDLVVVDQGEANFEGRIVFELLSTESSYQIDCSRLALLSAPASPFTTLAGPNDIS